MWKLITCSLKHLAFSCFFQIQSFPEVFAFGEVTATGAFGSGPSHIARHLRPSVKVPEKGRPSKSSANELKRRALFCGRWVWEKRDVPDKWILIYLGKFHHDLTSRPKPGESWLVRGIIPKLPYFRLVKYYNLPRYMERYGTSPITGSNMWIIPGNCSRLNQLCPHDSPIMEVS